MNIPNCMSVFRIVLIPFYLWVFLTGTSDESHYLAAFILVISAITDMLDGFIARKFNMVTNLGKILDPFADKLTLGAVIISLWVRFPLLWPLFTIYIVKELIMVFAGIRLINENINIDGAKWFGKMYTCIFYLITIIIVAMPGLPNTIVLYMLLFMGSFTLFTLFMYIPVFMKLKNKK